MIKKQRFPPKIAEWLLKCITDKTIRDSALGDFEEQYRFIAEHEGRLRAKMWYWLQLIQSIPSFISDTIYWSAAMFKNYFKIAYRSLLKNKFSSFINIIGLSTAIGCSLVVFMFIDLQYNMDTYHKNAERIFLIENVVASQERQQIWGNSPVPLAPMLERDLPQIKRAVRIANGAGAVHYKHETFRERLRFVDEGFLDMFTFPLKYGEKRALSEKNFIILSEQLANKYFGDEDAIGKQLTIEFDDTHSEPFFVGAVLERQPLNSSFGLSILLSYEKLFDLGLSQPDDWNALTSATFVELHDPNEIDLIEHQMDKYIQLQNASSVERRMETFLFDPLLNLSLNSHRIKDSISGGGGKAGRVGLPLIALSLIVLACFNYMNIAIASASRRLKEIGIRKVVGSSKSQQIIQFMSENLLLCLLALGIGITLSEFLFIPTFLELFGLNAELGLNFSSNIRLWVFLVGLLLFTALGAGGYPALYISTFQPVTILRGKQKLGHKNLFTRILTTFQFVLSFIVISIGLAVTQNVEYQKNRDWGYHHEQTIVIPIEGQKQFTILRNEISQNANVLNTAGSVTHVGRSRGRAVVEIGDKKYEVARHDVGFDYVETVALRLKAGRSFNEDLSSDIYQSLMVNETFVEEMAWREAIGKIVRYDNTDYYVIGVLENFQDGGFLQPFEPTIMLLSRHEDFNYLSVTAKAGTVLQTAEYLKNAWTTLVPDAPYNGFYQDTVFDAFFNEMNGVASLLSFVALVALTLSCMGLFGLVSRNIAKRMKEISIRKVLGASIGNIINIINRQFFSMLAIAVVTAIPLSYLIIEALLSRYPYRMPLGPTPFLWSTCAICFAAIATVLSQVYKGARANPVDTLRSE